MKNLRIPLRIVFYRDGTDWVAHCLEFDLMGDGPTKEEALDLLGEAITLQLEASVKHKNPRNLFSPADGKYFEMFAAGTDVIVGELRFVRKDSVQIERTETREYNVDAGDLRNVCMA
jgi:predicted RNase H-like HicB family nuclease